jgi:hypothetical protein
MPRYTCQVCKKALPCRYEGEKKKETIKVITTWTAEPIEVQNGGEQCYPCPLCESDETGEAKITHWDQVEGRMHKRLRQHFTRHHHKLLKEAYSSDQVLLCVRKRLPVYNILKLSFPLCRLLSSTSKLVNSDASLFMGPTIRQRYPVQARKSTK